MKSILLAVCIGLMSASALAQESDLQVKKNFEQSYRLMVLALDSAESTAELDSLRTVITSLESRYSSRRAFLDKALYPDTFGDKIEQLRSLHTLTYDRVFLIQSQGMTIIEYEERLSLLSSRLDSLNAQRDSLFTELQASRKNLAAMREKMRVVSRSLEARDRLIFALVDSIFLPYDKNLTQATEVQKEAITRKLLKSNVVARVYDIAADNLRFLDITQLQAKDYAGLIEQHQQFKTKWAGLREKVNSVAITTPSGKPETASGTASGQAKKGDKETTTAPPAPEPVAHVDAAMAEWQNKLLASFWTNLNQEFSAKGVYIRPFSSPQQFTSSIRSYIDSAKTDGRQVSVFVNEIWKDRIDKEWREALIQESILGRADYASLDKSVSELGEKKFDVKFVLYILLIALAAFSVWWFLQRKPKPKAS